MILLSCVNCCHNPLQSDSLGKASGYCTEHRVVLLAPSMLTCGRHFRKDLTLLSAQRQREIHERRFSPEGIVKITGANPPANGGHTSSDSADLKVLSGDPVGEAVLDYGKLPSKIASLAELKHLEGAKAELAMLSLGRAYVNRCALRRGPWTSGLHLFWWIRARLPSMPRVQIDDLRAESAVPLARQRDLAEWFLLMLRLVLVSDVGAYAGSADRVGTLASLADAAAAEARTLSPGPLHRWIQRRALPMIDSALPEDRYERLAEELRAVAERAAEPGS